MEACTRKFVFLKDLLNSFIDSCGIKVNYSKSMIVPINVSKDKNMRILMDMDLGIIKA